MKQLKNENQCPNCGGLGKDSEDGRRVILCRTCDGTGIKKQMTPEEIEKLAELAYPDSTIMQVHIAREGFKNGYTKCLESTDKEIGNLKELVGAKIMHVIPPRAIRWSLETTFENGQEK